MRATAQDQDAARLMGINVNRTISFTFALGGALAGAAGVLYLQACRARRYYDLGFQLGLIAFTAAVLGGIGNLDRRRRSAACSSALIQGLNDGASTASARAGPRRSCSPILILADGVQTRRDLLGTTDDGEGVADGCHCRRPRAPPSSRATEPARTAWPGRSASSRSSLFLFVFYQYILPDAHPDDRRQRSSATGSRSPSINECLVWVIWRSA